MNSRSIRKEDKLPERMLVVVFPHWPIVAHAIATGLAAVVIENGRVLAASSHAREHGVLIGQHIREAERHAPDLARFSRDRAAEFHAFTPIVQKIHELAPNLIVREPGWMAVPTRGPARYFGGERALVRVIDQTIRDLLESQGDHCDWEIGIAEGSFGATLAARDGVIVAPGETATFLADLPVGLIDEPELSGLLERLGIRTLGAFAQLRENDVLERFGMQGFFAQQRACARELVWHMNYNNDEEIVELEHFDEPIAEIEILLEHAATLSEAFSALLRERGLCCTICELSVIRSDARTDTRLWQRGHGWDARSLTERMRWQLSSWMGGESQMNLDESSSALGVSALSLRAHEVIDAQGSQLGFWDQVRDDDDIARICVRLEGMLGQNMVMQARLDGGRGPIERVSYFAFGEPSQRQMKRSTMPWPGQLPLPSPALVYPELPEIALVDIDGTKVSVDRRGILHGTPARVVFGQGRAFEVRGWSGPWPSEELWWDPRRATRRARLQLLLHDERALLVLCARGRWHLEGEYD
ncbi:MAG TPA: hypothetical protein VNE42_10625 [Acidimicrobiales bacterium]|nr:hypothetical protein [Acidimicrobiales bacterium]